MPDSYMSSFYFNNFKNTWEMVFPFNMLLINVLKLPFLNYIRFSGFFSMWQIITSVGILFLDYILHHGGEGSDVKKNLG